MGFIELLRITLGFGGILSMTELGHQHEQEGNAPAIEHETSADHKACLRVRQNTSNTARKAPKDSPRVR